MNPILEAALLRREHIQQPTRNFRIPRIFWYLRSRRARWLRQCLNILAWAVLAAMMVLALNACTTQGQATDHARNIASYWEATANIDSAEQVYEGASILLEPGANIEHPCKHPFRAQNAVCADDAQTQCTTSLVKDRHFSAL